MNILDDLVIRAKARNGTVIFAEGDESRTLRAGMRLMRDGVCRVILCARTREDIEAVARKEHVDLSGVMVLTSSADALDPSVRERFIASREKKGDTPADAAGMMLDPLFFSALYARDGKADAMVAGARSDTADVIRASMYGIGMADGNKIVSSFFLMVPPSGHPLVHNPVIFADCAVNPDPGPLVLRDIATAAAANFSGLFPKERARIAFLSFSTRGSAKHPMVEKVRQATALLKERFKEKTEVFIDGELQFDAALVPAVGERKSPGSPVAGKANIFIFPDLNSGNIGYKLAERLGRFTAIGPILQGTALPVSDLSRGCSEDDIYYAAAVTLLIH